MRGTKRGTALRDTAMRVINREEGSENQKPQQRSDQTRSSKKLKQNLSLTQLPTPAIELILLHSHSIHLTSLNKEYREEIAPLVFQRLKIQWSDLTNPQFLKFITKYRIKSIRIIDPSSFGEYHIDFTTIFNDLGLLYLKINSTNTTNWLKYRSNSTINHLHLSQDSNEFKIFNLHHISNFDHVTRLTLTNYHFQQFDPSDLSIESLKLVDCTWSYPFTIDQFNTHGTLKDLEIIYTNDIAFLISERFNMFLKDPGNLDLKRLTINFLHPHKKRTLNNNQMNIFIKSFPNLEYLDLRTWEVHFDRLPEFDLLVDERALKIR